MSEHTYTIRQTQWRIERSDYDEFHRTEVSIDGEGSGEYIEIRQYSGGSININSEEWPFIKMAVEQAFTTIDKSKGGEE